MLMVKNGGKLALLLGYELQQFSLTRNNLDQNLI